MSAVMDEKATDTAEFYILDELVHRFYEEEPRAEVHVNFGAASHPGCIRSNNEDNFLVTRRSRRRDLVLTSLDRTALESPEQVAYVMAVADGMGGHSFGELASELALRTGWNLGAGEVKWPLKLNERETEELKEKARVTFQLIDRALHAKALKNPELAGMGTTLTICYTTGPALFVLHAGDSRAYLIRSGLLRRLTRDHTLAQDLIDSGDVAPGSREARKTRHVLTNCLGGPYLSVDVDVEYYRLRDGDRVLVCSDGLTDVLDDSALTHLLRDHDDPQAACDALVQAALDGGGPDNVTAVIGDYRFPPAEETIDLPGPLN